jgi:excisionase family DNA binding protein
MPTTEQPNELLGYHEAARFLSVSERTVQRWVRERRIPFVQLPQRGSWSGVRFARSQLVKWLEQQTVRPARAGRETVMGTRNED